MINNYVFNDELKYNKTDYKHVLDVGPSHVIKPPTRHQTKKH